MEFITLILLVASLFVPLLYACVTLLGMKRKFFYPLLRFKKRDGTLLLAKMER